MQTGRDPTACRKDRQGICDHLVHFLSGFCATVDLVEHLSVLDKKNSGCVAGCLCTVGYRENSLAFLIHLIEHGKKVGRRTGIQCSGGFVRKDQFRLCDQRSCNCCPLLLSAGNFVASILRMPPMSGKKCMILTKML